MLLDFNRTLVDGETDEAHFILPVVLSLGEHFLVMSHGDLAGWAPRCPEVEQDDLTGLVLHCRLAVPHHVVDLLDGAGLVSETVRTRDADLALVDGFASIKQFLLDGDAFSLLVEGSISLNLQNALVLQLVLTKGGHDLHGDCRLYLNLAKVAACMHSKYMSWLPQTTNMEKMKDINQGGFCPR